MPASTSQPASLGRVLLLGKAADPFGRAVLALLRRRAASVEAFFGDWGDPLPEAASEWSGDLIISWLSRWIVPAGLLSRSGMALNFHPGPPAYPGIGCLNFALYEGAKEYGATCHQMVPRVDAGPIIAVRRMPLTPQHDVATLLAETHEVMFDLFVEILDRLAAGDPLSPSGDHWSGPARSRREFERLMTIDPAISEADLQRLLRATSFGRYQPWIELHGHRFHYVLPTPVGATGIHP